MTAKKQPAPTFMAQAMVPTVAVPAVADPSPITVTIPETPAVTKAAEQGPWYKTVLEQFPCDPEQRLFLVEQITSAQGWGGDDHMIRVPQGMLMAMMQELRRDRSPPKTAE